MTGILNERGDIINELRRQPEIQFTRIAQLQAVVDALKRKKQTGGRRKASMQFLDDYPDS
jgi:hypothetical protein